MPYAPTKSEKQRGGAPAGAIVATLVGSDIAVALGLTAQSSSPVIAICRKLIEAGYDPTTPMHVLRGETLALTVRSIGEGSALEINGDGTGFRARRQPDTGSSGQRTGQQGPKPSSNRVAPVATRVRLEKAGEDTA